MKVMFNFNCETNEHNRLHGVNSAESSCVNKRVPERQSVIPVRRFNLTTISIKRLVVDSPINNWLTW